MSPAEVLGVEVQQFTNGDTQVLVPRLVGATATAKAVKERSTGTAWNDVSLLAAASEHCTPHEVDIARRLLEHAAKTGTKLSWGKGVTPGVSGWYDVAGTSRAVWTLNAGGGPYSSKARLSVWFPELRARLAPERFIDFVERLRDIESFRADIDANAHKYPVSALSALTVNDVDRFAQAVEALGDPTGSTPDGVVTGRSTDSAAPS